MRKLFRILRYVDMISEWSGRLVSYLVIGMFLVLIYEIILRYVFQSPTVWAHETAQMMYGVHGLMAGAVALLYGTHVRMDAFYSRWSERTKAKVDSATALLMLSFLSLFLWEAGKAGVHSFIIQEISRTAWGPPIWIYKLFFPIAVLLVLLQAIADLIRNFTFAITGVRHKNDT